MHREGRKDVDSGRGFVYLLDRCVMSFKINDLLTIGDNLSVDHVEKCFMRIGADHG